MNKAKKLLVLSLVAFGVSGVSGCKWFKKKNNTDDQGDTQTLFYSFSVGLKSGASTIEIGNNDETIAIYDNGIDTADRSYSYSSTNEEVATIDQNGKITPKKEGTVNFRVHEEKSDLTKALKKDITIAKATNKSRGGFNYSGGTSTAELETRAEILGKLEKYAMDTHLTGITLFENGGLVKYSDRVVIPTKGQEYIEGYGFGILTDGYLNGELSGEEGQKHKEMYHSSIAQDSLKINQYTATGSQISDLASYITATYWGTRLNNDKSNYEWYPQLATDEIYAPKFNAAGEVVGYFTDDNHENFSVSPTVKLKNGEPITTEAPNQTGLYKKWRVYVKCDGVGGVNLKYKTASAALNDEFNNRGVKIEDYLSIYQVLFTGANNIIRGTEMANDTSYGIRGAQRFFNDTKGEDDAGNAELWNQRIADEKIGLKTGFDPVNNSNYIDIELINPIDSFTAMYTLSSSLVSPLPIELFLGANAIEPTMKKAIENYGTFAGKKEDHKILDYTLCLGAFTLTSWVKNSEIIFERNDDWFEVGDRYHIPGIYYRVIDTSTDSEKNWKQLNAGNLDSAGVPTSKVDEFRGKENVYETKGDATFKLNVNSCTQEEWDKLFGAYGSVKPNVPYWKCKPWMSNSDFLDGLFYSIDRDAFARKRGVNPSINYFSNAYQMRNSKGGKSYNEYDAHAEAVKGYSDNNGYNLNKAIDCFRNAVKQLSTSGGLVLGESKEKPTEISIHIRWMYQTDIKEYGEDIAYYFERAFNDDSVCGGKVQLKVDQEAVTNWEDVYNVYMMQGNFDLAFGAISGNTYNPLNFMEVLKSDNSSQFTLNWGNDTSKVDEKNPIIYAGKKWSFDALWEVADHGGIVDNGEKIDPVKYCTANRPMKLDNSGWEDDLYNGFNIEFPVEFAEFNEEGSSCNFDINRMDVYVFGRGNITLGEKGGANLTYDKANHVVRVTVSQALAEEIDNAIYLAQGFDSTDNTGPNAWRNHPFISSKLKELFDFELYYELSINGGSASVNYYPVEKSTT